jgi:hypothetical protein
MMVHDVEERQLKGPIDLLAPYTSPLCGRPLASTGVSPPSCIPRSSGSASTYGTRRRC